MGKRTLLYTAEAAKLAGYKNASTFITMTHTYKMEPAYKVPHRRLGGPNSRLREYLWTPEQVREVVRRAIQGKAKASRVFASVMRRARTVEEARSMLKQQCDRCHKVAFWKNQWTGKGYCKDHKAWATKRPR